MALAELAKNPEQTQAVHQGGHCVVLAGPGSGKTKTLTAAMARVLLEEVHEPQGVACITYNNECAHELETRLASLGVRPSERVFIGTVHSFALAQVIGPYARCVLPELPGNFRVATREEARAAVEEAHEKAIGEHEDPHSRWGFASTKRKEIVDRTRPEWRGVNPELADFIEAYEAALREKGLIDFDDMPLIAYRMVHDHEWIRNALRARFPILFVDEYQDLGHALHELVLLLCFQAGIRLFAVGDADQSIYGFTGANPELLQSLTERADVTTIRLRLNYRCGTKIIGASMAALGEERDYIGPEGAEDGTVYFSRVDGGLEAQANFVASTIIPALRERGVALEQIAVLYREAWIGEKVAVVFQHNNTAFVRADTNALVPRSSRVARFVEACAQWVTGGWKQADPSYQWLLDRSCELTLGPRWSEADRLLLSDQLIEFLTSSIDTAESTHTWLQRFRQEVIIPWRALNRNPTADWGDMDKLVQRTSPADNGDMPLAQFSGKQSETGRINLSTLHSSKGREFDSVILFGMNADIIPKARDKKSPGAMREARRLFYVGVTRPRKDLYLVFQNGNHSPWLVELHKRLNPLA